MNLSLKTANLKPAFSLIELLVVIAISGIILTIAGSSYITAQRQSRDVRRIQDMKNTQTAFEQYFTINGVYPTETANNIASAFQGSKPIDPKNPSTTYNFSNTSTSSYCVCATLEGKFGNSNGPSGGPTTYTCTWDTNGSTYYCIQSLQ